jgi:hypothetical protein
MHDLVFVLVGVEAFWNASPTDEVADESTGDSAGVMHVHIHGMLLRWLPSAGNMIPRLQHAAARQDEYSRTWRDSDSLLDHLQIYSLLTSGTDVMPVL